MPAKFCNEGANRVADILFGTMPVDGTLYFGLYKDTTEPLDSSTIASLSEVSGPGYERKALLRNDWVITDEVAQYAQQLFLASGGAWGKVYGSFLATSSDNSGKLMAIDHFDEYYDIEDSKGIKVTPKVAVN